MMLNRIVILSQYHLKAINKMNFLRFIKLAVLLLIFAVPNVVTSQIVIEVYSNELDHDEQLINDIGSNATGTTTTNTSSSGTDDGWEAVNAANVSSSALFKSPIVKFIIRTTTAVQTELYHFTTVKFRNLTNTGASNETIWLGTLIPIIAARRPTKRDISTIPRLRKKYQTGFASIYERSGRIYSATFTTVTAVYDLVFNNRLRRYKIRSRRWKDFPSELGIGPNTNRFAKAAVSQINVAPTSSFNVSFSGSRIVQLSNQSWLSIDGTLLLQNLQQRQRSRQLKNSTIFSRFGYQQSKNLRDTALDHLRTLSITAQLVKDENDRKVESSLKATSIVSVDVLVIVSNRGMCEYANLGNSCTNNANNRAAFVGRMKLAEVEKNNALKSINVAVRVVQLIFLEQGGWDPIADGPDFDALDTIKQIAKWRDAAGADLVAVIAGSGGNCGIGSLGGYKTITNNICLGQYTWSHEIGHCFAAHHNIEDANGYNSAFAFGYRKSSSYRTILSYDCSPSCPRVPYYSSSSQKLPDGRTLGSSKQDNLRQIFERAPANAQFRQQVALPSTKPTRRPTSMPIPRPTKIPTISPTNVPTSTPTISAKPTISYKPTSAPSQQTVVKITNKPTQFLSCQRNTCRQGTANLLFRRYSWFGRRECMTRCVEQNQYTFYTTVLGYKCGKCKK
jgi:Metallo-peptidase family M12B Reprolysin-like